LDGPFLRRTLASMQLSAGTPRLAAPPADREDEHRGIGGNALRASVLGANDGLVSNLSLVMGVAGAELAERTILITGLAGLLAGACSMAMGEWISVQSTRELYTRELQVERRHLAEWPEQEREELAGFYRAKGASSDVAGRLADAMMADQRIALDGCPTRSSASTRATSAAPPGWPPARRSPSSSRARSSRSSRSRSAWTGRASPSP
jgi:hypothetical protein